MHKIEFMVRQFVDEAAKGLQCIADHLADGFGDECRLALYRHFEEIDTVPEPFSIRASNIGRPLCQLQYQKQDNSVRDVKPIVGLYGDIVEDIVYVLLISANVPVTAWQEAIQVRLKEGTIRGTLDCIIDFGDDPRVWDIKSSSGWAFDNKFDKGFDAIFRDDAFGYCTQLFLYAEAKGIKAGGFIIIDKSSGDIKVVEVPDEQESYKRTILERTEEKVKILNEPVFNGIQKQFHLIPEKFKKKFTGQWILDKPCTFCNRKFDCWKNVRYDVNPMSTSKNPTFYWYADPN